MKSWPCVGGVSPPPGSAPPPVICCQIPFSGFDPYFACKLPFLECLEQLLALWRAEPPFKNEDFFLRLDPPFPKSVHTLGNTVYFYYQFRFKFKLFASF